MSTALRVVTFLSMFSQVQPGGFHFLSDIKAHDRLYDERDNCGHDDCQEHCDKNRLDLFQPEGFPNDFLEVKLQVGICFARRQNSSHECAQCPAHRVDT